MLTRTGLAPSEPLPCHTRLERLDLRRRRPGERMAGCKPVGPLGKQIAARRERGLPRGPVGLGDLAEPVVVRRRRLPVSAVMTQLRRAVRLHAGDELRERTGARRRRVGQRGRHAHRQTDRRDHEPERRKPSEHPPNVPDSGKTAKTRAADPSNEGRRTSPSTRRYPRVMADTSTDDDPDFDRCVAEALESLPSELRAYMSNVEIVVEDEPPDGRPLLGLYQGVPMTRRTSAYAAIPDKISIYRGPLVRHYGASPDTLRREIRRVVLHEIAHHFGIDDERLRKLDRY